MTEDETILKLIETVSPDDTAKLDEIDARVWAFSRLQGDFKISFGEGGSVYYRHNDWPEDAQTILHHSFQHDQYTRPRDALKAIRPEGWSPNISQFKSGGWGVFMWGAQETVNTPGFFMGDELLLPTEELAELHAIIQAIAYERSQK